MSGAPVVGVLALQGDVREHVRALEACGARPVLLRRASEIAGLDGVVLPGGESTTMSKLLTAFDVLEPLRTAIRSGLPAYGSCAGMILLADRLVDRAAGQQTLGGLDVTVRRNAFGRQVDSFETELDVPSVGAPTMHAVFIRAPWVEDAGPDVEVLARIDPGEGGPAAGRIVAARQQALVATSFHPELTGDLRLHGLFVDTVRERSGA